MKAEAVRNELLDSLYHILELEAFSTLDDFLQGETLLLRELALRPRTGVSLGPERSGPPCPDPGSRRLCPPCGVRDWSAQNHPRRTGGGWK